MQDRSTEKRPRTRSRGITYESNESVTPMKKVLTAPCKGKIMNHPDVYVHANWGKR